MSLYKSFTQSDSTWSYQGCYSDSSSRTLSYQVPGGASSIAGCQTACQSKGYIFAAPSYGTECWCDNTVAPASKKLAETQCNSVCRSGETGCG
jgi:hypothetical protein